MKKPRTVAHWRASLRWYSQQVNVAMISIGPTWLLLPEEWRAAIPPEWLAAAAATLGVLGFIGRLIAQEPTKESSHADKANG